MSRKSSTKITPIAAGIASDSAGGGSRAIRWIAACSWILAVSVVALGLNRLDSTARTMTPYTTRIEWQNLPPWLQDADWSWVIAELEQIPGFAPDVDVFDANVAAYVGQEIAKSPWIEHVDRVATRADGRVSVEARFRKPFTMIEKGGWAYMIDESGVRLPGRVPSSEVDYQRGMTVTGVHAGVPAEGHVWPGQDVIDGIKLIRFLWQAEASNCLPVRKYLRSVDVSNFDGSQSGWEGRLKILTAKAGNVVHWGRPPHEEYNIEASAKKKLEAMCQESRIQRWFEDDWPIDVRAGSWVDRKVPTH